MRAEIIRLKITKPAVDRMKAGQTLRDVEIKGFGVRRQNGAPSYFLQRRINGQLRWLTIGVHGSPWTPELARREALRLLATISQGQDPTLARQMAISKPSVEDAAKQFMETHATTLKSRTREEYARLLRLHIIPCLGKLLAEDVAKAHVVKFHASLAATPAGANFALAVMSKLFRWCEDMGYRPEGANPCRGIKKYRQAKHERFLSREELGRLGSVLGRADIDQQASLFAVAAIWLLILTGARLNEILTLQWRFVDLERRLLLLPDSKTGQKTIRLSDQAADVFGRLPRVKGNPHVIVGSVEGSHLVNLQKPWRRIRSLADLEDVRIHDLRHTFASVAAASGGSLPMIGALLGHTQPQTTARYAHLASDPLRQLNEEVGNTLAQAMGARGVGRRSDKS